MNTAVGLDRNSLDRMIASAFEKDDLHPTLVEFAARATTPQEQLARWLVEGVEPDASVVSPETMVFVRSRLGKRRGFFGLQWNPPSGKKIEAKHPDAATLEVCRSIFAFPESFDALSPDATPDFFASGRWRGEFMDAWLFVCLRDPQIAEFVASCKQPTWPDKDPEFGSLVLRVLLDAIEYKYIEVPEDRQVDFAIAVNAWLDALKASSVSTPRGRLVWHRYLSRFSGKRDPENTDPLGDFSDEELQRLAYSVDDAAGEVGARGLAIECDDDNQGKSWARGVARRVPIGDPKADAQRFSELSVEDPASRIEMHALWSAHRKSEDRPDDNPFGSPTNRFFDELKALVAASDDEDEARRRLLQEPPSPEKDDAVAYLAREAS